MANFWKLYFSLKAADMSVRALWALFKPLAISAVWLSNLAEVITAKCYSDCMLLLEAMECEERDSSSKNNNNNRLLQKSEFLAVGCLTLSTDSTLKLMQIWIKLGSEFMYFLKQNVAFNNNVCFQINLLCQMGLYSCPQKWKPSNQLSETWLNWKKVEKKNKQTSLMHLYWFCVVSSLPEPTT